MKKHLTPFLFCTAASLFSFSAFAQYGMGGTLSSGKSSQFSKPAFQGLGFSASLPAAASLKQYAPMAKSQGVYPSCSGWATAYQAMTIHYAKANNLTHKSHITAHSFCPSYVYNKIRPEIKDCGAGKPIDEMLMLMISEGAKKFYMPLMGCGVPVSSEFAEAAKNYRLKDAYILFDWPADIPVYNNDLADAFRRYFAARPKKDVNLIKQAVAEGYPVIIGAALPTSFYGVNTEIWMPTPAELADPAAAVMDNTGAHRLHAMTIVGYDDNKNGGSFEVMNSWSEGWGNKGFFWIRYSDFQTFVISAFAMEPTPQDPSVNTKTGCVWGNCKDGYGFYRFNSMNTYEGYFKNNVFQGYGIYTWKEGAAYAGQWINGKRDGEGTQYFADGTFGHGTYAADKLITGYSQFTTKSGDTYKGTLKNEYLDGWGLYTYANGVKYLGFVENGKFSGLGKYSWPDGKQYLGYFENGKRNGKGVYITEDKKALAGDWVNDQFTSGKSFGFAGEGEAPTPEIKLASSLYLAADCISGNCLSGNGTRSMPDGTKYVGDFTDGLENGRGIKYYQDGEYEGLWVQGSRDGVGIFRLKNGLNAIGEFNNEQFDGYVFFYDNTGKMFVDFFRNGKKIFRINENATIPSSGVSSRAMDKTLSEIVVPTGN
jgi:hypothetical protein